MIMNTHQHLFCGPSPLVKQDQWPVSIQCTKLSTGVGTNLDKSTEKKKRKSAIELVTTPILHTVSGWNIFLNIETQQTINVSFTICTRARFAKPLPSWLNC